MRGHPWGIRRKLSWGAALGTLALTVGVVAPAAGESPSWHDWGAGHQRLDHVFIIMEENHARDNTIGDPSMPFLTSLASRYPQATNYYGVTHTSEPNYIAATSGDNWGVNNDNGWDTTSTITHTVDGQSYTYTLPSNRYDHTNIVDELEAAHIPWAAYMDGMPSAGFMDDAWPGPSNQLYASKHNPFILYNDVRLDPSRADNIKPFTAMAADLNSGNAPRYVWISPDQCNDMHGGVYTPVAGHPETPCPYSNAIGDANDEALKAKADAFLKMTVETIMHSRAWTGNSAIFVTADENDFDADNPAIGDYLTDAGCCDSPVLPPGDFEVNPAFPGGVYGGGLVPMVVVTPHGRHMTDQTAYNHYSMLLTIEQGFGLGRLGNTSDARQVKPMWTLLDNRSGR